MLSSFKHFSIAKKTNREKDAFETLTTKKSKWTPPEGQFTSRDYFIKKCCHDVCKLKSNCNTKLSNLSKDEWTALINLKNQNDHVIQAADKGGLQALKYSFNQCPIKKPSLETLLRLAELVLMLNCFLFGDNYYANLFVGFIENKFFSNYHGPKPDLYKRYIHDCVSATSSSREELNLFINSVNSFHPALKYTCEISENSLAFLDIKLSINDNGSSTSVHYKPTDSHNYLPHSPSHPQHVKNAILFSQFLRLRHLCSDDTNFKNKCEEMCQFFQKRGYPDSTVTTGKHSAQEIDRETALQTSQNKETDRNPFTLTYHHKTLQSKMLFSRPSKFSK